MHDYILIGISCKVCCNICLSFGFVFW